jgi:hypothetical protein
MGIVYRAQDTTLIPRTRQLFPIPGARCQINFLHH